MPTDLDSETLARAAIDHVKGVYESKILALIERIEQALSVEGCYAIRSYEMSDTQYEWEIVATREGGRGDDVDIRIEISESAQFDGEMLDGINFGLTATEDGGRILATFLPYNYTSRVWVRALDHEAVRQRWNEFSQLDVGYLAYLVTHPS